MPLDVARTRQYIRNFDFTTLFIEELGWDYREQNIPVPIDDQTYTLNAVAQKRSMVAFECAYSIPDYATRRKIERQLARSVHEHMIIYTDKSEQTQIWQWVKREVGRPAACREHRYHCDQPGDSLIQKLQSLAFAFEEEEELTIVDVTRRVRAAFDVDRVTKRFYDRFKSQHASFLKFIEGIPDEEVQRWYASVMLNRLMFIYFIQKKGFLNNDHNYLRTKLVESQLRGRDCFYMDFLCPLFFQGFAQKEDERSEETQRLLGKVPYLNGGIFLRHEIEELHGEKIQIADAAFEKLFDFFEQYYWHLDERPLRADNEINPDVLGYIFEKYINQKQMGAYYTKEDITEYISQDTVIPYLFGSAYNECRIAFVNPVPEATVWRLLRDDPDRYIYDAVKRGAELPLPEDIAAGLNDVSKRTEWNKPAPEKYALPTEIWREVVERRKRYSEVRSKLENGEISDINDLITYNMDICQFAQDVIQYCEGPELLRAFWDSIKQINILDPACGSGAFLFAALNILEPLYEACIDRMEAFIDELDSSGEKHHPEKFSDFRKVLNRMSEHPNPRYFILKSIMVNNLYGVDIMDEAIEICKLRMFLKLVAQVEEVENLEPLPDIDFNVRAGNTLVGYASLDDVRETLEGTLGFAKKEVDRIEEKAQDLEGFLSLFQEMQTERGMSPEDFAEAKLEVRQRMKALEDELNRYLAGDYGIDVNRREAYDKWFSSHKPFHWFIEFHGIMKDGGFDVIIGNPPYVEYSRIRREYTIINYRSEDCKNLYAFVIERALSISNWQKCIGFIVPLSLVSTDRFASLRSLICKYNLWISNHAIRPAKLFEGVEHRLSIISMNNTLSKGHKVACATKYRKWSQDERSSLLNLTSYSDVCEVINERGIPKLGSILELSLWKKVRAKSHPLSKLVYNKSNYRVFYTRKFGHFVLFTSFIPSIKFDDGSNMEPTELKFECLKTEDELYAYIAHLNSTLTYWYLVTVSDCRNLNKRDVLSHPVPILKDSEINLLADLGKQLMIDFRKHASHISMTYPNQPTRTIEVIHPTMSYSMINEIDGILGQHYGFTDEEMDFIINYDAKYRMGGEIGEDDE